MVSVVVQGFRVHMQLEARHKEEGKVQLGLFTHRGHTPSCLAQQPIAVQFKLCAQKAGGGESYSHQLGQG